MKFFQLSILYRNVILLYIYIFLIFYRFIDCFQPSVSTDKEELLYVRTASGEVISSSATMRDLKWATCTCPNTWLTQGACCALLTPSLSPHTQVHQNFTPPRFLLRLSHSSQHSSLTPHTSHAPHTAHTHLTSRFLHTPHTRSSRTLHTPHTTHRTPRIIHPTQRTPHTLHSPRTPHHAPRTPHFPHLSLRTSPNAHPTHSPHPAPLAPRRSHPAHYR